LTLLAQAVFFGFPALFLLAWVLRWRYRIWLACFLSALAVLAGAALWLSGERDRKAEPAYAQSVLREWRARPWPADPREVARLIPVFHAAGGTADERTLRRMHRLSVEKAVAQDPPLSFPTVGDALAWRQSLDNPKTNDPEARRQELKEIDAVGDRAVRNLLDVKFAGAPGEWPQELQAESPLLPGSRPLGGGLWIGPKGNRAGDSALQFPIRITRRGEGRIEDVDLFLIAYDPSEGDPPRARRQVHERFMCRVKLHDFAQGESRLFKCEVKIAQENSPGARRKIEDAGRFRAGALAIWPSIFGWLEYEPMKASAEPADPDAVRRMEELKASDRQSILWTAKLRGELIVWLQLVGVVTLGFVIPGLRGRAVSIFGILGLAVAGLGVGLAISWHYVNPHNASLGWEPILAILGAVIGDILLIGGVTLADVVFWRDRSKAKIGGPRSNRTIIT
jgi:hypothetical protein